MTLTVHWLNRFGEPRQHTLESPSESYARNWWRINIEECQGVLSVDERRASEFRFLRVEIKIKCPECGKHMETGKDLLAGGDYYAQCRNENCSYDGRNANTMEELVSLTS